MSLRSIPRAKLRWQIPNLAKKVKEFIIPTLGRSLSLHRSQSRQMKIFRYYESKWGIDVLRTYRIRTSLPNDLNDPFELSPNIHLSQFDVSKIKGMLQRDDIIHNYFQHIGATYGFSTFEDFKKAWLAKDLEAFAKRRLPSIHQNVLAAKKEFADFFTQYWRIICTNTRNNSILMWSHYAKKHSGIVVEFDILKPPFSEMPPDCIAPVDYSVNKADFVHHDRGEEFRRAQFLVAFRKASKWGYEKEVRILVPKAELPDGRTLQITPLSIKSVILGSRIDPKQKSRICALLLRSKFRHVTLKIAELHESKYTLRIKVVPRRQVMEWASS